MAGSGILSDGQLDGLIKAILVFSRTADHVLEQKAVELAGEPLSESKTQILRLLGQQGPQTAGQIARFLGVSRPAVTQIIDALVASRLVRRQRSRIDRRGVELWLTDRGRRVFGRVRDQQRVLIRNMARSQGAGEVEQWVSTLQRLAAALARADRTYRNFCMQCGAFEDGSCVLVGGGANCLFLKHRENVACSRSRSAPARKRRKK